MALALPLLLLMMAGTVDFSRAFYQNIEVSGAQRAGLRTALISDAADIGESIRQEPNTAIPDNSTTWGPYFLTGAYGDCAGPVQACGDPNGCSTSGINNAFASGNSACFAVQRCKLDTTDNSCPASTTWGNRPVKGQNAQTCTEQGVRVLVVYKFKPATPIISQFTSTGGAFFLRASAVGNVLYC
jgi:Flp pilus assembly protein TadG